MIYYRQLDGGLVDIRGGSRTAATSKMERFVIIVNGWKQRARKGSILDVAAVLDQPLNIDFHPESCQKNVDK